VLHPELAMKPFSIRMDTLRRQIEQLRRGMVVGAVAQDGKKQ